MFIDFSFSRKEKLNYFWMKINYPLYVSRSKVGSIDLIFSISGPINKDNSLNDSQMDVNQTNSNSQSAQIQSITQLILSLDMEQWENLVEVFHIETCMIHPENDKLF